MANKKNKLGKGMGPRAKRNAGGTADKAPAVSAIEGQAEGGLDPKTEGETVVQTGDTLAAASLQNLELGGKETVADLEPEAVRSNLEDLMRDSVDAMRTGAEADGVPEDERSKCNCWCKGDPFKSPEQHAARCPESLASRRMEEMKKEHPLLTVTRPSVADIEAAINSGQRVELKPNGEVEMGLALGPQADGSFVMAVRVREGIIEPLRQQAEADRQTPEEWLSERCGEYLDQWWSPAASR